jgi:hypothetical protein
VSRLFLFIFLTKRPQWAAFELGFDEGALIGNGKTFPGLRLNSKPIYEQADIVRGELDFVATPHDLVVLHPLRTISHHALQHASAGSR